MSGRQWIASDIAGLNGPAIFVKDGDKNRRLFNVVEADEQDLTLAAAAPDLLDALESLYREIDATTNIGWDDSTLQALEAARAAIDKARNQS